MGLKAKRERLTIGTHVDNSPRLLVAALAVRVALRAETARGDAQM